MKGVVFNLLEEVVSNEHGPDAWDALLDAAGLSGSYTSLGSYPDQDLSKLVGAASTALKLPADSVVRWFAGKALPRLAYRYPQFFAAHRSTRSFLLTLNEIIHPEVRKLYPGADAPSFEFDASSADALVMWYRSPRKLCAFAEGLIQGAAAHFGERVAIEQPQCMHRRDAACELRLSFARQESH